MNTMVYVIFHVIHDCKPGTRPVVVSHQLMGAYANAEDAWDVAGIQLRARAAEGKKRDGNVVDLGNHRKLTIGVEPLSYFSQALAS